MKLNDLLGYMKALGDKLPQAWPIILSITEDVKRLLVVLNGGKQIMLDTRSPLSGKNEEFANEVRKLYPDVNATELRMVARTFEAMDQRIAG